MAFWDFLVSLLNRFGLFAKPAPPAPVDLKLDEVTPWLDEQTKGQSEELEHHLMNHFSEIRFLIKQVNTQLTQLGQTADDLPDAPSRLQKVVESTQHVMLHRLGLLVQKLEPPRTKDWQTIQNYCQVTLGIFQRETNLLGKNIAYTSLLRKNDLQDLAARLVELETVLKKISEPFESRIWKDKSVVQQQVLELSAIREKNKVLATEETFVIHELSDLRERQLALQTELEKMEHSPTVQDWSALQNENQLLLGQQKELQQSQANQVARIEKPLKRFNQLVSSGALPLDKSLSEFVKTLTEKPLTALELDPKADRFKQTLLEIQKAIQEQKIVFKDEKEKTRYLQTIEELLAVDFFSAFFWKKNELVRRQNQLHDRLQTNPFLHELAQKKENLENLRQKTVAHEIELAHKKTALKKNSVLLEEKKAGLEGALRKVVQQPITVQI